DVAVEEITPSFNVYPNPVENNLYIETELNVKEIAIYDIYGRKTKVYGLQTTDFVNTVDVTELKDGVYFVKIMTDNGEVVKRFIKK
ncbi:MAG: T9SS type A sorting domain-containing protein, partial [Bacteroidales bacterium]|nr:T9SS type A sorting domain-containing protein [Bacteroidales bacterium]